MTFFFNLIFSSFTFFLACSFHLSFASSVILGCIRIRDYLHINFNWYTSSQFVKLTRVEMMRRETVILSRPRVGFATFCTHMYIHVRTTNEIFTRQWRRAEGKDVKEEEKDILPHSRISHRSFAITYRFIPSHADPPHPLLYRVRVHGSRLSLEAS